MRPDKNTVRQLLSLSDDELIAVIKKLCEDNRIDSSTFSIGKREFGILRTVLANASDADIEAFLKYFTGGNKNGR